MLCSEIIPLLELLLDREIEPGVAGQITDHLTKCRSCSTAWTEVRDLARRTGAFVKSIRVPDTLQVAIKENMVDSEIDSTQPAESGDKHIEVVKPGPATESERVEHDPDRPNVVAAESASGKVTSSGLRPSTILCERNELIRFGLKQIVSEAVQVVGEAADGMAAIELIRRLRPDFVILDVDLDILNGVEVCRRLVSELPRSNVLVLTDSYNATKYHNQLIRAGARGFCLKSSGPRTLFEAIDQVTHSLPYCDPKIIQLVKQNPTSSAPNSSLTDRETEVLIRLDLRNKEISEELDMKLRTVEKHIECILAKLKVPTRTAAALKAVQLGYVLLPKMPGRDPVTGVSHEQTVAELQAELAVANEHLMSLLRQNATLRESLLDKNPRVIT